MKIRSECLFCAMDSLSSALRKFDVSEKERLATTRVFAKTLSEIDPSVPPPVLGRTLHNLIKKAAGKADPYAKEKKEFNDAALKISDELRKKIRSAPDSFRAAAKASLAGNLIDFGLFREVDFEKTRSEIDSLELAIDDLEKLKSDIKSGRKILFIGDNCGEAVFDKIFIETIKELYGDKEIYFAVRSAPIINDAVAEDALYVGLDRVATVVETGSDVPGALPSEFSEEFNSIYESADVIISKGQGNFECLDEETDKNIYFALAIKCPPVAERLGSPIGSFVFLSAKNEAFIYKPRT